MTMIKDFMGSNQMRERASDAVPNAKKIKTHESEFKFFVSIFRKLEEVFSSFSYVWGYKAAVRSVNYESNEQYFNVLVT